MYRKPNWALLYFFMLAILGAMLAAHFLTLPGIPVQVVLAAGLVAVPIVVLFWLQSNHLALLHSGAEKDDLYEMTSYEYRVGLWIDGDGQPRTIVAYSESRGAEAKALEAAA